ncbi:Glycosyltransferase [Erythrobacter litoralis]|nr:glycosyltransferase family 2 protein [Erythrobacter litoralis]AOL24180.1 Glycosyltransferase [Erythrobacter litoralis]
MSFAGRIDPVAGGAIDCSFVIPFFNERESLEILYHEIAGECARLDLRIEFVFVDDGSTDGGREVIDRLAAADERISLVRFRRNFGKSAALSAGFREAAGDVVFTMDADLQDNPCEIGNFLSALEQGHDCVTGWKQVRNDPLDKTLPSKLFNGAVNKAFGLSINDHNCGFKAYRRELLGELEMYGELHRFVPALLHARGYRVGQIAVEHRARRFGKSKFGTKRLIKGALDLMTVWLTTRYAARPLHLFGGGGLALSALGFAILGYLSVLWVLGLGPIGDRPLLMLGMLLVLFGGQMISVGLVAEVILRRTIGERDKYSIAERLGSIQRRELQHEVERQIAR